MNKILGEIEASFHSKMHFRRECDDDIRSHMTARDSLA